MYLLWVLQNGIDRFDKMHFIDLVFDDFLLRFYLDFWKILIKYQLIDWNI